MTNDRKPEMPRCRTCKHWREDTSEDSGKCGALSVDPYGWADANDDTVRIVVGSKGDGFWTGPDFGCVHHEIETVSPTQA